MLISVSYSSTIPRRLMKKFIPQMQKVVANRLHLKLDCVEVETRVFSEFDIRRNDLAIIVDAFDYPLPPFLGAGMSLVKPMREDLISIAPAGVRGSIVLDGSSTRTYASFRGGAKSTSTKKP